ncbi:MAG: YkgJ family cysteine cluster protein [Halioglobus sp.]
MECRSACGACCIAPSITEPFYGMPAGKPAGVRCVHLDAAQRCRIFNDSRRPAYCGQFRAEPDFCGDTREQALAILLLLDEKSVPGVA